MLANPPISRSGKLSKARLSPQDTRGKVLVLNSGPRVRPLPRARTCSLTSPRFPGKYPDVLFLAANCGRRRVSGSQLLEEHKPRTAVGICRRLRSLLHCQLLPTVMVIDRTGRFPTARMVSNPNRLSSTGSSHPPALAPPRAHPSRAPSDKMTVLDAGKTVIRLALCLGKGTYWSGGMPIFFTMAQ